MIRRKVYDAPASRVVLAGLAILVGLGVVLAQLATSEAGGVVWVNPSAGEKLSGTVTLKVNVPDGTEMVYFKVDEDRVAIVKQAPFEWELNTKSYADGEYRLRAAAYSGSKQIGTEDVTVNISNGKSSGDDQSGSGSLSWVAPNDGATLSGTVTFKVSVPANTSMVYYKVEEDRVAIVKEAPFEWEFDTKAYNDGEYRLRVAAYSASTQVGTVDTTVRISNKNGSPGGGEPTPTPKPKPSPTAAPKPDPTPTQAPKPDPEPDPSPTPDPEPAPDQSAGSIRVMGDAAGYDWSLPAGTEPAERSGFYGYANNDLVNMNTVMLDWATMHKGDGKYDFSALERILDKGPVVLRLKVGESEQVPAFIRARHNWFSYAQKDSSSVIPGWQSGWIDEWTPFINALGQRFKNNPNLAGYQVQLTSHGGEGGYKGAWIETEESKGLTPAIYRDFLRAYHTAGLNAFSGQEWKVFSVVKPYLFTGPYKGRFSEEAYAQAARDALLPLMDRGLGLRVNGRYEFYEQPPEWTQHAEISSGRLVVKDTTFEPIVQRGHLDNEIENYYGGNQNGVTATDESKIAYGIRVSLMRVLAERHSYVWLDGDDAALVDRYYPGLIDYAKRQLGKRMQDDVDAWTFLGEFGPIKEMPRGLMVTNLGQTGDGVRVDTSGLGFVDNEDMLGRSFTRMDVAVAKGFLSQKADIKVIVTYMDNNSSFRVRVGDTTSARLGGGGSGKWRSVSLSLSDFAAGGGFSLEAVSGNPVVQQIRVVK